MSAHEDTPELVALAKGLKEARLKAGLTIEDAAYKLREMLPASMQVSREKIRRYEVANVKAKDLNPIEIAALAATYEAPLPQLSPTVAEECRKFFDHMNSTRPLTKWKAAIRPEGAFAA